ncbi:MAG: helix-turn-helix transcriptional regulator [Clostridia bacterium]|nr:helix-turn-helix transcriptional regulator [Clostridia bacterium]
MENNFGRTITLLRKERKLSQKQVANDMGVSQALLSHYEKGIRHCSFELLVAFADYYNVSCDYLLGRTSDKNGQIISIESTSEPKSGSGIQPDSNDLVNALNKRILSDGINVLYSILDDISNKSLTNEMSAYLDISVYKMLRMIYSANPKNLDCFFSISEHDFLFLCDSALSKREYNISRLCNGLSGSATDAIDKDKLPLFSYDKIEKAYSNYKAGLLNLIKTSETKVSAEK